MRIWGLVAVILAGAIGFPAAAAKCKFVYSSEFREHIVVPELKKVAGDDWKLWDWPPSVTIKRQTVHLLFGTMDPSILDSSLIKVLVEDCGRGSCRVEVLSPFPAAPRDKR